MPSSEVQWLTDGVPAFHLVNTCRDGRYRIEKQIITDPHRDTVLQKVHFIALARSAVQLSALHFARAASGEPWRRQYRMGG